MAEDDFEIRPGRQRDAGEATSRKAVTLAQRVERLSRKSGGTAARLGGGRARGTGHRGRGRSAALARRSRFQRRVLIKARVVRHRGHVARGAPLARHLAYLGREGTTRDGSAGRLFDASSDDADSAAFARRCESDRHHFRFIVSPENASDLADLQTFTRELMADMAQDLGSRLDWIAIDHWNTASPHIHVLLRGVASNGHDLVIDRAYIASGLRHRAEERVTAELGPRSERDIRNALAREVDAERWTSLDRHLHKLRDEFGIIDLRPDPSSGTRQQTAFLIGRAQALERMGLAERIGTAIWEIGPDIEPTLRALGERGDIIRTMHRALAGQIPIDHAPSVALHDDTPVRVIGRLIERGLHDELTGEAYAIIEGCDGRAHHLRFPDLERTGDAVPGAIVESTAWTDRRGRARRGLAVRSDLTLDEQVRARGATWLDRQLVGANHEHLAGGFGTTVAEALEERIDTLIDQGLAKRQGGQVLFARNLLDRLRGRELGEAAEALAARYGRPCNVTALPGDHVAGIYRERVVLASGRYAMIDNRLGFQLVPWRQDLERHLGLTVSGEVNARGRVDWSFTRSRGLSL